VGSKDSKRMASERRGVDFCLSETGRGRTRRRFISTKAPVRIGCLSEGGGGREEEGDEKSSTGFRKRLIRQDHGKSGGYLWVTPDPNTKGKEGKGGKRRSLFPKKKGPLFKNWKITGRLETQAGKKKRKKGGELRFYGGGNKNRMPCPQGASIPLGAPSGGDLEKGGSRSCPSFRKKRDGGPSEYSVGKEPIYDGKRDVVSANAEAPEETGGKRKETSFVGKGVTFVFSGTKFFTHHKKEGGGGEKEVPAGRGKPPWVTPCRPKVSIYSKGKKRGGFFRCRTAKPSCVLPSPSGEEKTLTNYPQG